MVQTYNNKEWIDTVFNSFEEIKDRYSTPGANSAKFTIIEDYRLLIVHITSLFGSSAIRIYREVIDIRSEEKVREVMKE